jgi:hypothetical protein
MTRLELATIIMEAMVHRFGPKNVILETNCNVYVFDPPTKEQLQYYLEGDKYFPPGHMDGMTYEQTVEYYHNRRDKTDNEYWWNITLWEEGR